MTLLVFDVDGTLVYSERRDSQCFAATFEALYGQPFPSIDWERYPHVTDTTILSTAIEQYFRRPPRVEEVVSFQDRYVSMLAEKRRFNPAHSLEVPGARAAVERLLSDRRFLLGVATGGWQRPARLKLRHIGIPDDQLLLEGSDGRPTREAILEALIEKARNKYAGITRITYVGDAPWDVRTTRNLGLNFVGIRWQGDGEVLHRAGAHDVLNNYLDYEAFMAAIERARPPGG